MRILGGALIVLGLLSCLTIVGIFWGVPMILVGAVLMALGGRRHKTVIHNVVTVSNVPNQDPRTEIPFSPRLEASLVGERKEPLLFAPTPVPDSVPIRAPLATMPQCFVDAFEELTLRASAILENARKDGYQVDVQNEAVTMNREGRAPVTLRSNEEVLTFGKFAGF